MTESLDFHVRVETKDGKIRAWIITSPEGEAEDTAALPFSNEEARRFLGLVDTARALGRLNAEEKRRFKHYSDALYAAAFPARVHAKLVASIATAKARGMKLRVRLEIAPELAPLPWEYLHDPDDNQFLALSKITPLVRYLPGGAVKALEVAPPLRVLVVTASPRDRAALDEGDEVARIQNAVAALRADGQLDLTHVVHATVKKVRAALQSKEHHVFHFIGHGTFADGMGALVFEKEDGTTALLDADQLGVLFGDHASMRLAVLNACEGARISEGDPFGGVAQALIQRGLGAAIAMQSEITDDAAKRFAEELYTEISHGEPIDAAVAASRAAMFVEDDGWSAEWGAVVVYLRAQDGRLFVVSPPPIQPSPPQQLVTMPLASPEVDVNGDGVVAINAVYDCPLPRMLRETQETSERSVSHGIANLPLGRSARRAETTERRTLGSSIVVTPHNLKQRVLFVGRSEEVEDIELGLAGQSRATITTRASLYGFGGVGKTAIAREIAWRAVEKGTYPGGVFWVEAEGQPLRALPTLAAAITQAGLASLELDAPAETLAASTHNALASARAPTLVVLDNVDHEGWNELIPGGAVRLLLTTRDARFAVGAAYEVEALHPGAAVSLAKELAGECAADDGEALREVVTKRLAGLPVAIEVAAKTVKSSAGTWRRYEKFLEAPVPDVMQRVFDAPEFKISTYPRGVFAAMAGSIDSCSAGARRVFDGTIVFAAENVPVSWIAETAELDRDSLDVARAITELANRSLLKWNKAEDAVSMHRLVHACGRELAASTSMWAATNRRGATSVRSWLEVAIETSKPAEIEGRREHVREALRAAELAQDHMMWVEIADHLGTHLRNRGLYRESRGWLESCLVRLEPLVGPNDRTRALLLANLGTLLNVSGSPAEARPLFERALAIAEAALGPGHPSVGARLVDLATSLSRLGKGDLAVPLLERAHEIALASFGPDHPRVAACLADLGALLLNDLGAPARARPMLERALQIDEAVLGPRHATLVGILVNLASALQRDERDDACALLQRAVDIVDATPYQRWWELSTDSRNLGRALVRFSLFPDAQKVIERVVALDRGISADHPVVAADLWLLSVVVLAQNQSDAARPLLEEARGILAKVFGPEHPDTIKVQMALARLTDPSRETGGDAPF